MGINFKASQIVDDVRAVQAYVDKLESVAEVAASIVNGHREDDEVNGWEMDLLRRRLETVGHKFE